MKKRYVFRTQEGPFYIAEFRGRFYPVFGDEHLGGYETAESAAEGLVFGSATPVLLGIDASSLGIPWDLKKWERLI